MKHLFAPALLGAVLFSSAAFADVVVVNGDTTGGPTWNRTLAGEPPTLLSLVGTDVAYEVTPFTVSLDGSYSFTSVAGYDNFLHLYQGAFDPTNQFAGVLIANDDFPDIGISGFDFALQSGVSYFAVASGFENSDFGAYTLTISGPGDITLGGGGGVVPEPQSWVMLIAGFGLVGAAARRRRNAVTA